MAQDNIEFKISLNSGMVGVSGNPIDISGQSVSNILLCPFYAIERDIYQVFMDEPETYLDQIRLYIFEASIKIDDILTDSVKNKFKLTDEQAFRVKRTYVICTAITEFAKVFYRDYLRSVKKSKFLADIKISLEIEREPKLIQDIQKDASECAKDFERTFSAATFSTFVKGQNNPCNRVGSREWYPSTGHGNPKVSIATGSYSNFCRKYKIGDANHGYTPY